MSYDNIIYSVSNGIAKIQLNRPKVYNALNEAVNREILSVLNGMEAEGYPRVLIITGNEKAFAAGADIGEMAKAGPLRAREIATIAVEINDRLESIPIPVIAAVSGLAWGGGFELALACDFRIGDSNTSLKLPEVALGIIPGANGTQRLLPIVGAAKAKEMVMLCKPVKGEEAYRLGLLTRLAADGDVLDEANRLAEELMVMPGKALAAAKTAIRIGALETITQGKHAESPECALLFDTHDQKEGMAAFMDKRPPNYTNN